MWLDRLDNHQNYFQAAVSFLNVSTEEAIIILLFWEMLIREMQKRSPKWKETYNVHWLNQIQLKEHAASKKKISQRNHELF